MKHLYKPFNDHKELILYPDNAKELIALWLMCSVYRADFGMSALMLHRAIISTKQAKIHELDDQYNYPLGFAIECWGLCTKFQLFKLKLASKLLGTKINGDLVTLHTQKLLT